jgi:hypothetical protein
MPPKAVRLLAFPVLYLFFNAFVRQYGLCSGLGLGALRRRAGAMRSVQAVAALGLLQQGLMACRRQTHQVHFGPAAVGESARSIVCTVLIVLGICCYVSLCVDGVVPLKAPYGSLSSPTLFGNSVSNFGGLARTLFHVLDQRW